MRRIRSALLLLTLAALMPTAAVADPHACLLLRDLKRFGAVDDEHIELVRRNGTVWRGDLDGKCLGISVEGFSIDSPDGEVCGGAALLHLLRSGNVCRIMSIEPVPKS